MKNRPQSDLLSVTNAPNRRFDTAACVLPTSAQIERRRRSLGALRRRQTFAAIDSPRLHVCASGLCLAHPTYPDAHHCELRPHGRGLSPHCPDERCRFAPARCRLEKIYGVCNLADPLDRAMRRVIKRHRCAGIASGHLWVYIRVTITPRYSTPESCNLMVAAASSHDAAGKSRVASCARVCAALHRRTRS